MRVVGGRDVHDVDAWVGREFLVAAVRPFDAESPSEVGRAVEAAGPDGCDPLARVLLQGGDELVRDPSRAQDAPAQGRCDTGVWGPSGR